jgi:GNAT superfamily N-acetyltransferase
MDYVLKKGYQGDGKLRSSFNELATETFGLNFENWYQSGYWGEKYIPYSIIVGNQVVSNVSVNLIDCGYRGRIRHYVQFGTVMTRQAHRHRGYCRLLMETVLKDYASCDGFFLYANDNVLGFYPRFGFQEMKEYRYEKEEDGGRGVAERVSMETKGDWSRFLAEKNRRSGNGLLDMQTDGLLMFYLAQFMREDVFYVPQEDAYVVAEIGNGKLVIYDVYSPRPANMVKICGAFGKEIRKVQYAFPPRDTDGLRCVEWKAEDTTFFVLGQKIKQDMETIKSFPEIVHA